MRIAFHMLKNFLKRVLLIDIFDALSVGIKCLFRKPVTRNVSDVRRSPKFRTEISVIKSECIKCGRCAKICPSKAIKIEKDGTSPTFDLKKCCYCNLCQKSCLKSAIELTSSPTK